VLSALESAQDAAGVRELCRRPGRHGVWPVPKLRGEESPLSSTTITSRSARLGVQALQPVHLPHVSLYSMSTSFYASLVSFAFLRLVRTTHFLDVDTAATSSAFKRLLWSLSSPQLVQ
jgi:hypothetical protein